MNRILIGGLLLLFVSIAGQSATVFGEGVAPPNAAQKNVADPQRAQKLQLMEHKQKQIERLQIEIDRLALETGSLDQVLLKAQCLQVKDWKTLKSVISVPLGAADRRNQLAGKLKPDDVPPVTELLIDQQVVQGLKELVTRNQAKLLQQTQLVVLSGQRAAFQSGEPMPHFGTRQELEAFLDKRQATRKSARPEDFASGLQLKPRITAAGVFDLEVDFSITKVETTPTIADVGRAGLPGLRKSTIRGHVSKVTPADTLLLTGLTDPPHGSPVVWMISFEIIKPLRANP